MNIRNSLSATLLALAAYSFMLLGVTPKQANAEEAITLLHACHMHYYDQNGKAYPAKKKRECTVSASVSAQGSQTPIQLVVPLSCTIRKGQNFCYAEKELELHGYKILDIKAHTLTEVRSFERKRKCVPVNGPDSSMYYGVAGNKHIIVTEASYACAAYK